MRIKTPQAALLTNHEVLLHMQKENDDWVEFEKNGRRRKKSEGYAEVIKETLTYLTNPDYPTITTHTQHPNRPMTLYKGPHSLLRALAPKYRLNKTEYLQIYNVRPRSIITLLLVIEEGSVRFKEHELEDMLSIITRVFDEEEAAIPAGVEDVQMEGLEKRMLGVTKKMKRKRKD